MHLFNIVGSTLYEAFDVKYNLKINFLIIFFYLKDTSMLHDVVYNVCKPLHSLQQFTCI